MACFSHDQVLFWDPSPLSSGAGMMRFFLLFYPSNFGGMRAFLGKRDSFFGLLRESLLAHLLLEVFFPLLGFFRRKFRFPFPVVFPQVSEHDSLSLGKRFSPRVFLASSRIPW